MKNFATLLVPTDFSPTAKAAAQYACNMAVQIKAKVILLSVIELEMDTAVLHNWKVLEKQLRESAVKNLGKWMEELKWSTKGDLNISMDLVEGVPMHEVIEQYAIENKVNMIVMGTKGASGLNKILRGTNTATLIEHSSIPVIAIPSKATFSKLKRIVYASDMTHVKKEIKRLADIASVFQAQVMVLHAVPKGEKSRIDKNLEPDLIKAANYPAVSYHQVQNDSVGEAINEFVDKTKADMLAMFTEEQDFHERLFGKSMTRSMAYQSRIPLLAINRTAK